MIRFNRSRISGGKMKSWTIRNSSIRFSFRAWRGSITGLLMKIASLRSY